VKLVPTLGRLGAVINGLLSRPETAFKVMRELKRDLPGISGGVDHLAIDPCGPALLLAAEDHGTCRLIDLKTHKPARTVKGFRTPHSILSLPEASGL
jgi:hypothetical protein